MAKERKIFIKSAAVIGDDQVNLWAVPYGNMMTILMIFFMILWAFAQFSGNERYERVLNKIEKQMGSVKKSGVDSAEQIQTYMAKTGMQKFVGISMNSQKINIRLMSRMIFDSGSAVLKDEAFAALKQIGESIKNLPSVISIEGHTDNIPLGQNAVYNSNWSLSAARAYMIAEYFINDVGIDQKRIRVVGFGEFRPIVPNDTEEYRALNRRIEINILR